MGLAELIAKKKAKAEAAAAPVKPPVDTTTINPPPVKNKKTKAEAPPTADAGTSAPDPDEVSVKTDAPETEEVTPADTEAALKLGAAFHNALVANEGEPLPPAKVKTIARAVLGLKRVATRYIEAACASRDDLGMVSGGGVMLLKGEVGVKTDTGETVESTGSNADEMGGTYAPGEYPPTNNDDTPGFTLYINCFPVHGETYMELDELLVDIVDKVQGASGGTHPLAMDYSKGLGLVAAMVATLNVLPYAVHVDTDNPYASRVLSVLMRHATRVVRGRA